MSQIVFHTDVTKVLSADSYIVSRFSPDLSTPPPADPNASIDFSDLVDVVTNEALLQYRPAENQAGLLNQVCKHISLTSEAIRKPVLQPIRNLDGVTKDAQQALASFVPLIQTKESIKKLAEWVRFQVSTSYLQNIFWANNANNEQELLYALDAYKRHRPTSTKLTNAAIGILGPQPFGYALERINRDIWSPIDFFIAYAFWAYIKGCRFARNLGEGDVYIVHWLRKNAIMNSDNAEVGPLETLGDKIPWGTVIQYQLSSLRSNTPMEPLGDALIKLRRYSKSTQWEKAVSPNQRLGFLADGLVVFNEAMGLKSSSALDKVIDFLEKPLVDGMPLGSGHFANFFVHLIYRPAELKAKKTIKVLASTDNRVSKFIENG